MTDETIQTPPQPSALAPLGWLGKLRVLLMLFESPVAMIGAGLVLFWIIVALLAPLLAPYQPNVNDYAALAHTTPSAAHWLGTDNQGRDILSRIIWGSRTVLTVGPVAVACAYVIGCLLGLLAGDYRGWVDVVLMRLTDIVLSFPIIILYIIIITTYGPSAINIVLSVTFTAAPQVIRIVR